MTATSRFTALDRLRLSLPRTVFGGAQRLVGSAVSNARASLDLIEAAVGERRVLADHLDNASESGDLSTLTEAECYDLLARHDIGRLAYLARTDVPDIVPVNYAMDGAQVLIRSGMGPKLQAAERRELVAFEVDELDEQAHTGTSVVLLGRATLLSSEEAAHYPAPTPWARGPRRRMIRLEPQRVQGRRIL